VTIGSRQILSGTSTVNGDFQIPPPVLAQVVKNTTQKKANLIVTPPTGRFRYVAFNTKIKPFDNLNVRKAVIAAFDRTAMRQAFGGPLTGQIPTHFIPRASPVSTRPAVRRGRGSTSWPTRTGTWRSPPPT